MVKHGQVYKVMNDSEIKITGVEWGYVIYSVKNGGTSYIREKDFETAIKQGRVKLITDSGCSHVFKQYTGIIETYNYCIHCDYKQGMKEAM